MKRLIAAGILIVLSIFICITAKNKVDDKTEKLINSVNNCRVQYNQMKYEQSLLTAINLEKEWVKSEKSLYFFVDRDLLQSIGEEVSLLKIYVKERSDEDFLSTSERITIAVKHLIEDESFSF